jgi:hypothetical protein
LWESHDVEPGRYTVVMKQDTGPLAGLTEGRADISIEQ